MLSLAAPLLLASLASCASVASRTSMLFNSSIPTTITPDGSTYPFSLDIAGDVGRTDNDWVDGFAIDVISPTPYEMTVDVNLSPIGPRVVSTMGGSPWVLAQNYSWTIAFNSSANDLIGKIEAPYDPVALAAIGIAVDNTYLGVLSTDGTYWMVDETVRNVHHSENKTRILRMTSMDGEYILLGRKTVDVGAWNIQYGYYPYAATRTLNITAGAGMQNGIFIDGFNMAIESLDYPLHINANIQTSNGSVPSGWQALTSYDWKVNSTITSSSPSASTGGLTAQIKIPYSEYQIEQTCVQPCNLRVAYRAPGESDFIVPARATQFWDPVTGSGGSVTLYNQTCLDGTYILIGW